MLEDMLEDVMEFSFYHCYIPFSISLLTLNPYLSFKHVTSTYNYHNWYLVFEFTFDVTYFHRVIDI